MGVVFEAYDREHACHVALKVLPSPASSAVVRFKNEFRFLQGIYHPNLVSLGELIDHEGQLFFTMELVRGVDLLAYIRHCGAAALERRAVAGAEEPTIRTQKPAAGPGRPGSVDHATPDESRLRATFAQLTHALMALHAHDKVHCDVKPSNVLVTCEGRTVLLDFGLVTDTARARQEEALVAGTISYMSPEQARGVQLTPSSDWYSVGALLYEALTGSPPFTGSPQTILQRKQAAHPAPPSSVAAGVPEELDQLCCRLLAIDPRERPTGDEVLSVLAPEIGVVRLAQRVGACASPFVGRDAELAQLHGALRSLHGQPLVVVVEGESGVGKTALVGEFLDRAARSERPPLVFRGRCSERELVPFKAFDPIIEPLAEHLEQVIARNEGSGESYTEAIDHAALAFPLLAPLGSADGTERAPSPRDQLANRHLAFRGVRELIKRLAEQDPIVICIDDWQWADADSAALLSAVLAPPQAAPVLLLLVCRAEADAIELPVAVQRIALDNLSPLDAEELALRLFARAGRSATTTQAAAREIATESTGHPLFIAELVHQALAGAPMLASSARLDEALFGRVASLDATSRAALELLAVARSAVPLAVLRDAMAERRHPLSWPELPSFMARLAADHLAKFDGLGGSNLADCFHDRVANAILARLPADDQQRCHQALAAVLERSHSTDFESLAVHWDGAGDRERAADYSVRAGDRAMMALAFERAMNFYRLSLELCPGDTRSAMVREKLGHSLSHLGRGREAAQAFLEASSSVALDRRIELSRLAADQLLRSGYIDDAIDLIERVFRSMRLSLPGSPRRAFWRLLFRRLQLAVRGFRFRSRHADEIPAPVLARIDACWSVAVGLSTVDNLRGAYLQTRHLLMALSMGEPYRVLRALASEAGYRATAGLSARRTVDRLLARADRLARDLDDPGAVGFTHLARGIGMFLRADWGQALGACEAAEAIFEGRPIMTSWELASARMFHLWSSFYRGELGVIRRRVPELVVEAEARGDLYAATCFRLGLCSLAWLIADQPDQARHHLEEADKRWSVRGVHLQHYWSMLAWVQLDLYQGRAHAALARVRRMWPLLEGALLFRIEHLRIEIHWCRARSALALAQAEPSERRALLMEAGHCAHRLVSGRPSWSKAIGHLVLAGVHNLAGRAGSARDELQIALKIARTCQLEIIASVAEQRLAAGTDGALATVTDDTPVRPDRWVALFAPGFSPRS